MKRTHLFTLLLFIPLFSQAKDSKFLWGSASASFQVEGSPADSDWKDWTHQPGKIVDGTNADMATDFWNRFEEDFKISKSLGLNSYRLSIAWERIFPEENKVDEVALEKYVQIINKMRSYDMEPLVTLHHFVLPKWLVLKGGLLAPNFVPAFVNYTQKVVGRLSQSPCNVKYWITFNEPNVLVRGGYIEGDWPPGKKGAMVEATQATAQLIRAHVAGYNEIKNIGKDLQVSIAHHWRDFQPKNSWNPLDHLARKISDWVWNEQIVSSLMTGKLRVWMPGGEFIKEDLKLVKSPGLDFLGINYYGRSVMSFQFKAPFVVPSEGPGPKTEMGWEIYPQGLENSLLDATRRYHLPVMVTENGIADKSDAMRTAFLEDHISALKKAEAKGAQVLGYYYWSLTDNFEWARGSSPRFGLVEIDYEQAAKRIVRPSALVFKKLIKE